MLLGGENIYQEEYSGRRKCISIFSDNRGAADCSRSRKQKNVLEVDCISGFFSDRECSIGRIDLNRTWNAVWIQSQAYHNVCAEIAVTTGSDS